MFTRHHHLSASVAISITIVAAIFFGLLFWFRPWDTPDRAFGVMLAATAGLPRYTVHTTGDAVLRGPKESLGLSYWIDGIAHPRSDALADYSFTINSSGAFRSATNERSTFTSAVDVRIVAGRVYTRLVDFQLSNDLKPRFQDYLSVYRGVWYRLPQDALGRAARGDSATLTDFAKLMGLIHPVTKQSATITAALDGALLKEFVNLYVHARGILPPPTATQKAETAGEDVTGGQATWQLAPDGAAHKVDGKFSTTSDALGGSLLTATFSTTFVADEKAALPVTPERPVDYDVRQLLQ